MLLRKGSVEGVALDAATQNQGAASPRGCLARLGMSPETLRRWIRDAEIERGERDGVTVAEQVEIRDLRRQIRRLEEEKLILQKAAYFARETGRLP